MSTKFHVWHYTALDVAAVGGVEQHIAGVSAAMRRLGHHVHVGLSGLLPLHPAEGAPEARIVVHTHGDRWPSPRLALELRRAGARWIHVCHGNSLERVLACREYASVSGWKGVFRDCSLLAFSDAAVAVSLHALRETRRFYRFSRPARVIPNGADLAVFRPLAEISRAPRLIFLGRSGDRVKNARVLLSAAKLVRSGRPDFELVTAPGIESTHPYVKTLGKLAPPALAAELANSRALALCSLYEGDPLVLREAMAMGLPVVASDIPAVRETLAGYVNAEFFAPRDPKALARSIERALYGEPQSPSPMPRGWDDVAREYAEFYESLF